MRSASRDRLGRYIPVWCLLGLLASGSLAALGRGVEGEDSATASTPASTTLPADEFAPNPPPEKEASREWARGQLLSGLVGGKHDFSQGGRSGRDLCLPCHTPHLAAPPPPQLDRRPVTTQPLRPFQGPGVVLTGWSLLCLGCHDGITARDVYSSPHAVSITGRSLGLNSGAIPPRSHPVGVSYPANAERYESAVSVEAAGLLLPDGRIQCTTCHDAHNTHRHRGMLRIPNDRSRLCLTCHRL